LERHSDEIELSAFRIGEYLVRPDVRKISGPGGDAHVEPRVMAVLVHLATRAGLVVSREELLSTIWGTTHVTDDAITRCISAIRKLLGDDRRKQRTLQTIPKRGYRIVAPVVRTEPAKGAVRRRRSRLTLKAVLASCSDHIYVFDRDGRYLYASEAGAQAAGMRAEDLIGKSWRELGMPATIMEPFQERVRSIFNGGPSIREKVSYPTIFGTRRYEYILDPIFDNGREVTAVLALVRDITEDVAQR
jgi:PAS domain S-box-containing protein